MVRAHRLATRELAAWWRARHVPVLYPVDLAGEQTYDVPVPEDAPALELLARVASTARLSVFVLHAAPQRTVRSAVAVAGSGEDAVLVDVTGDSAEISRIGPSDGVRAIGELLPELPAATVPTTELAENDWSATVAVLASDAPEPARRARLQARGLPDRLVDAMLAGAAEPRTVGTVGAQVFVRGQAQLGPSLLSWQELPAGALLTYLHAPRRPGPVTAELGPYRRETVWRALPEAVSTALYRNRE